MTDAEKTLATQLTLLFDGKTNEQIAEAIIAAVSDKEIEPVCWTLCWHAGINVSVAVSPTDILNRLDDFDDMGRKFVGDRADLVTACKAHEWGDLGDYFADAMDEVIEELEKAGLVTESEVEEGAELSAAVMGAP
jgi:hypothetical protein